MTISPPPAGVSTTASAPSLGPTGYDLVSGAAEAVGGPARPGNSPGPVIIVGPPASPSGRAEVPKPVRTTLGPGPSGFPALDGSDSGPGAGGAAGSDGAPASDGAAGGYIWVFAFDGMPTYLPPGTDPEPAPPVHAPTPEGDGAPEALSSIHDGEPPAEPPAASPPTSSEPAGDPIGPESTPDPIGVGLRLAAPIFDLKAWEDAIDHLVGGVDDILEGLDDLAGDDAYLPWAVGAGLALVASEASRRARSRRSLALAAVDGSAVEPPT